MFRELIKDTLYKNNKNIDKVIICNYYLNKNKHYMNPNNNNNNENNTNNYFSLIVG